MKPGKTPERAADGSAILRHTAISRDINALGDVEHANTDEIEQHMARHFGPIANVFHEIVSDKVHIDVHFIAPTPERNEWTLFTTGMSALPMSVPEGAEDFQYGELMISLPPTWKVDALGLTPPPADLERWYWPVRWLKQLARLPHDYNTWLGTLHTIPNGDPPRPFSSETKLCGWVLIPPFSAGDEAQSVQLSDGRVVHLYSLYALHANEMELKLKQGGEALFEALSKAHASEVLDLARPSVAGKKKKGGLFH
jgi:hypothetical protein